MLISRELVQSSAAITPFISTPAAATIIMSRGCTWVGALRRWMASMAIQPAMMINVSALRNAAKTPARWYPKVFFSVAGRV